MSTRNLYEAEDGLMRLYCYGCGKSVSTEVPDETILRAVAICPECVEQNFDVSEDGIPFGTLREAVERWSVAMRKMRDEEGE